MDRFICIHGHFYQPPRENPWLEAIEIQDSAFPYHDWNERIAAECYAPNAVSRIWDTQGRIARPVNNYTSISFDFGPTVLLWMQKYATDAYEAILEADRQSVEKFFGHGNALAQAYNHMILPLANSRDKNTQIIWGIKDFEYRFGRKPEGLWLPETAVDLETLDLMAQHGIGFTILAPRQASRVRPIDGNEWRDVSGGRIDPGMAYRVSLPSGRAMALFFYDGPISHAVAFEGLLNNGEAFANRLLSAFPGDSPRLVHIATDGESYGHHHRGGDMALAHALHHIESNGLAQVTNYARYLEDHPPAYEVEVFENSSWSCEHGIERWRSDCGCNSGGHSDWNQAWRAPLRAALDWLRDAVNPAFEQTAGEFLTDPWAARDDYIDIIVDRSSERITAFMNRHASRPLNSGDDITVLNLMELQRHAMLMYTSCGWFFDELSGIETVQVIQYAGRVLQLADQLFSDSLEPGFLEHLERARSNIPEHRDGRSVYEKFVSPGKRITTKGTQGIIPPDEDWLDLENLAQTQLMSGDASHPIESALKPCVGSGWQASEPGQQTVRLLFDKPLRVRRVHLAFHENEQQRTHEFSLRWSSDGGRSYREIVRQQYNFSPPDNTREIEDYEIDLVGLTVLEISISPDISGGCARASIAELCLT